MRIALWWPASSGRHLPRVARGVLVTVLLFSSTVASAADPLHIVDGRAFQVRANDGPNNVGVFAGDNILTGAWISPTVGTSVTISQVSSNGSIYPGSGTTTWGPFELPPLNSPALPFEFSTTYSYAPSAGVGLLGSWNFTAVNPGSLNSPLQFQSPSIVNATLMPLATNARLTNAGGVPTVQWNNPGPASFTDIHIHDLSLPRDYFGLPPDQYIGFAPIVHEESSKPGGSSTLPGNATSFAIPTSFSSGLTLDPTHEYALSIIRYQTEQQTVNGLTQDWVISRSRTFANFRIGSDSGYAVPPSEIFLPTVTSNPDLTGTQFAFDIEGVGTGLTFIDPAFAVGYEYEAGAGDPAFRSVMLPSVGDGVYLVEVFDSASGKWVFWAQAQSEHELLFSDQGVRRFRVLGIEDSAALDPNDPTAFVTGLSFVGDGRFTGRMLAIVPEPGTWILLLTGLALLAICRGDNRSVHPSVGAGSKHGPASKLQPPAISESELEAADEKAADTLRKQIWAPAARCSRQPPRQVGLHERIVGEVGMQRAGAGNFPQTRIFSARQRSGDALDG